MPEIQEMTEMMSTIPVSSSDSKEVSHAPKARFEYWRERMKKQKAHCAVMRLWPTRKEGRQTLNLEFLESTGSLYMQKVSLSGKTPYKFHKIKRAPNGRSMPLLSLVHICKD
jgi:hypothetical protein